MILIIEKKEFADAVQTVARFAERKSATLPALGGIMLLAGDGGIKLRATNLETSIDLTLPGSVKSSGVVVLPAPTFRDVAGSLAGSGTATIEHKEDVVVISSGGAKSTLKTLPHEDFPFVSFPDKAKTTFKIAGITLKNLISSVAVCASTSSIRPELAAVYVQAEGGVLKAVATDSFRLAEKKLSDVGSISPFSMLIPAKNATDIIQILPDTGITVSIDEHLAAFRFANGMVSTRLVSVAYPDYAQIIPKTFTAEATVLRKDFEGALKRAAVFSDAFSKVKVQFDVKEKKLALSSRNSDVGESNEPLGASTSGESIELSFNHRYLQTPLPLFGGESITLSSAGIGRPLVIRGVGDTSLLYLVMPMNQ